MSTKSVDKVRISKDFSRILRHTANDYPSLSMRADGFVSLEALLKLQNFARNHIDVPFVRRMVEEDCKTRFSLLDEDGKLYIRANQGHSDAVAKSITADELLVPIKYAAEIPIAIHGTSENAWKSIQSSGLHRMRRSHIHFSPGVVGVDAEVRSGMRPSSAVHVYLDTARAMAAGIRFYRSSNNVILSDGIDGVIAPQFFSKVVNAKTNSLLYSPNPS